jgi:site-specific recombinase XerD
VGTSSATDSIRQPDKARRQAAPGNARPHAKAGARRPQRLPRSLTAAEAEALLAQPNGRALTGVRDRALIAIMLRAGLRCAEALQLRQRDIDFDGHRIRVLGKGKKERVVPIDPILDAHLREWRARRPSGERFFNTVREPKGRPLDAREIRRMVKRRGQRAGINDVHPHLLRHTCATVWISRPELELHEVQLLLGHARLTTTQRYLHASVPTLVEKFRAFT